MKAVILDDNHIEIVASEEEIAAIEHDSVVIDAIKIDNQTTFVCNNEPSSTCINISGDKDTLFNVPLSLNNVFSTDRDIMFVFIQLSDMTFPYVIPCYDNKMVLEYVAEHSGIFDSACDCEDSLKGADIILLYYGFKLALSILENSKAIKYWNRLFRNTGIKTKCNCHGQ